MRRSEAAREGREAASTRAGAASPTAGATIHETLAGPALRERRRRAGLSRAEVARAVGAATWEVRWWEETGRLPDPDRRAPLDEALRGATPRRARREGAPSPLTRPEPVVTTELGALYRADCLDVLRSLEPRSVHCVFADPPFNLGKDYGAGVIDTRGGAEYLAWCRSWLDELSRVLAPGGALFLYNLPRWNVHLAAHLDRSLEFRHWIAVDLKFSLPIASRLYPAHYALLYFIKGPRPRVFAPPRLPLPTCRHCGGELRDYGGYKDKMNPAGVNLTDVWIDIPPVRHRRYKNRGANELALKMLDRVLDIATLPGDVVLDPFAGSGTTLAAAELRGRRWIGIELGDCRPAVARLAALDGEREQLRRIRARLNVLFTPETLALRARAGHDTTSYRSLATPPEGTGSRAARGAGRTDRG